MKEFTFDDLPMVIGELWFKIDNIEKLLKEKMSNDNSADEEPLSVDQAAEILKLSIATIYTKVCKNEIPVNKQGKRLYFYRSELLDWIKSGRIKTINEIQQDTQIKSHFSMETKDITK